MTSRSSGDVFDYRCGLWSLPHLLGIGLADIPDDISVTSLGEGDLPGHWRRFPAPETLAEIGTKWVQTMESAVLRVPSAVIPQESNFLLNPAHPDFPKIQIESPAPFTFDPRMWRKATKLSGA